MRPSDQLLAAGDGARPRLRRTVLAVLLAFAGVAVLFVGGDFLMRHAVYRVEHAQAQVRWPITNRAIVRDMALNAIFAIGEPVSARLLELDLPLYDLLIEDDELQALHRTADQIVARGKSTGVQRIFENARFCHGGEWVDVEIKLRGLVGGHYNKNHFSFRLKMPANRLLDGKRLINLVELYDKGLVVDAITHRELAQHGLLTLRDRFAVVRINGAVVGLFQEFEHFSRSVADGNRRPEGYIFTGHGKAYEAPSVAWDKASAAMARVRACAGLDGTDPGGTGCGRDVEAYFDVDRVAWAAAMVSLMHSEHAWHPDNVRLFWDPARGAFEPIPWDYAQYPIDLKKTPDGEPKRRLMSDLLLGNDRVRGLRDRKLWTLIRDRVPVMQAAAQRMFDRLSPALKLDVRHPDFAVDVERLQTYSRTLRRNAAALRQVLEAADLRIEAQVDASGALALSVHNHARSPVELRAVMLDDGSAVPLSGPVTAEVAGSWQQRPGEGSWRVTVPAGRKAVGIQARNVVTGQDLVRPATRWNLTEVPTLPPVSLSNAASWTLDVKGVRVEADEVRFAGRVELSESVRIPRGRKVIFEPGLDLKMGADVSLMIEGDFDCLGRADAPVHIGPLGNRTAWGGLAIQGTQSQPAIVNLQHCTVTGGTGSSNERTWFTSSFAVHGGVVTIADSAFRRGDADDGINLKNCRVDIRRTLFFLSKDDAVDCDFCTGRLVGNTVRSAGGDGFDFSGSDVILEKNLAENCGDKGFSIGERTIATLRNNIALHCNAGVAAKDASQVTIEGLTLRHMNVGIAHYVKKPTFGPPVIRSTGVTMEDVSTEVVREVPTLVDRPGGCKPIVRP